MHTPVTRFNSDVRPGDNNNMIRRFALATGCITLLAPFSPATAAIDGFVGGGVGHASLESEDFFGDDNGLEDDRMMWQVYAGWKFAQFLGVEAHYTDFGEADNDGFVLDSNGVGAALGLYLPLTDRLALSARAGQLWWDADASIDDLDIEASSDGEDPFYGVGAHFGRDEGLGLSLRYDRYELDTVNIDVPSINLELGF
jgi:hypothetical protein